MKKEGKTRRSILIIFAVALFVTIAIIFVLYSEKLFNFDFKFVRDKTRAESAAILTEVRNVLELNTVEAIFKTVFPFDFVPSEMDWPLFLRQIEGGRDLSLLEQSYLQAYRLCKEIGIHLERADHEFVVITSIVKCGFNLLDSVEADNSGELLNQPVFLGENETIFLRVPDAVITDLIIEDATKEDYSYPDIAINPENWKKLVDFLDRQIREKVINEGILEIAGENGRKLLGTMLRDAGYRKIIFVD
jgi:hypothetical protein